MSENRIIKVLHLRNCRGISTLTGPETYLIDLLAGADTSRFDLQLICTIHVGSGSHDFTGVLEARGLPFTAIRSGHPLDAGDYRHGSKLLRAGVVDLIHSHDARSDIVGLLLSRRYRTPFITFAHGWVNWDRVLSKARLYAALERYAVSRSDRIVVASRDMEQDLVSRGVPRDKICYVPYCVDVSRFHPSSEGEVVRAELGIPMDALVFGCVGRFHPWKGHGYLVEAAKVVLSRFPEARFVMVGDAAFEGHRHYQEQIVEQVQALGLSDQFVFAGSRRDMPGVMNAFDVFVLPSLREPFGIVSLEAQACGKPVIGSHVDGIPETMIENTSGVLVPPGDPVALANAMLDLLNDTDRRRTMGEHGRHHVSSAFSVAHMVERTQAVYEAVMKARPVHA